MNKLLLSTILSLSLALAVIAPRPALAEETCTQVYGQGVVCGVKTPEEPHVPVQAGLADFSLRLAGIGFILTSVVSYTFAHKRAIR